MSKVTSAEEAQKLLDEVDALMVRCFEYRTKLEHALESGNLWIAQSIKDDLRQLQHEAEVQLAVINAKLNKLKEASQ